MSAKAHHAINSLFSRFVYDCKRFRSNQEEMQRISDYYFRYRDLLHDQESVCDQIVKVFGILGVHSPDVSPELAESITSNISQNLADVIYSGVSQREPISINSAEVRDKLKLWEILELFLSSVDNKASVSDFRSFLFQLDMSDKATPQAVESAVKTHPDLFQERMENGQKFLLLRHSPSWIRTWEVILRSIRTLVAETKRQYAPDSERIELIEQPARTVVIRANGKPGATVQASIALQGDRIEVKTTDRRKHGTYNDSATIEIYTEDSTTVYSHEGQAVTGPEQVAEIILSPILDCFRTR